MTKRIAVVALAALAIGPMFAAPARAQYYRDDYGDYRPRRPPPDYGYDGPGYRERGEFGDRFGRRGASVCVTARGNCVVRPAPFNTPCGCEIPGFGFKRGAIGG